MNQNIYHAINRLIKINREHKRLIDSQVAEIGLHRTQHRILMYLARKGNLPSQKQLAEFMEVSPAAITGALQKLECDGYIDRKLGEDNRFNEITITQKGREIVEQTKLKFAAIDDGLFKDFTQEEIVDFTGYLERIFENMKGTQENEKMV